MLSAKDRWTVNVTTVYCYQDRKPQLVILFNITIIFVYIFVQPSIFPPTHRQFPLGKKYLCTLDSFHFNLC